MKNAVAMVLAATIGTGVWANGVPEPVEAVCLYGFADPTIRLAQVETSKIFSEVGVEIAWRRGRACEASDVIHIYLSNQTSPTLMPGALAYARPYKGTYIEVFYDRVTKAVGPATLTHLLAHVLTHEITHILQGTSRHSETGIMKAGWNENDHQQMRSYHLPFAPEDVELIHLGIKTRVERRAQNVTPSTFPSR